MRKTGGFFIVFLFATLAFCTTYSAGDETSISHPAHLTAAYGPLLGTSCDACHDTENLPYFKSGTGDPPYVLDETDVCDECHSPGGIYNGVDNTTIGAKANWHTGVYEEINDPSAGNIIIWQTGKEKWCVTCHDDVPSVVGGVSAPNVVGDDTDYGYYVTGHGRHGDQQSITCLACHDPASMHADGELRTYTAAAENYQAGYRLKSLNGWPPMEVPRPFFSSTGPEQFRLCFSCHDSAPFMTMANTDTNFRSDVDRSCVERDPSSKLINQHWYHLQPGGPFYRWDSDWDGTAYDSYDSLLSCPACHNVHGPKLKDGTDISHAPAMIRTGELIDRESALNLDYFANDCPDKTRSATNETLDSTGGMMKFQGPGRGTIQKNGVCLMCHNESVPYWREPIEIIGDSQAVACEECHVGTGGTGDPPVIPPECANTDPCEQCHGHDAGYEYAPGEYSSGEGTAASHSTHTENNGEDQRGPILACDACHDTANYPYLKSGTDGDGNSLIDLTETNVCDGCHSRGGSYDGVDDPVIGAKNNWDDGVYVGSDLAVGKEKWCVGCHDDEPSVVGGISAPNMAGDDVDYGYYISGHGKHGNQRAITCFDCHDTTLAHVDGDTRTYTATADNYQVAYRLKSVDGQAPMDVPRTLGTPTPDDFALCFSCHDSTPFITRENTNTNFRSDVNNSCAVQDPATDLVNKHWYHLQESNAFYRWDSDWDGSVDSIISCTACHNIHGPRLKDGPEISHAPAMIRTGELIGLPSAVNLDYLAESCPDKTPSATNELSDSTGGAMKFQGPGPGTVEKNGVCVMCHNEYEPYWREPKEILSCESCHNSGSHVAHLAAPYGPEISCDACHDLTNVPYFKTGTDSNGDSNIDLSETDDCNICHSPGGSYEGLDDPVVGAKPNWASRIYTDTDFQPGKERWCLTCHDEEPSVIEAIDAPNVAGNDTDYGYYVTGHGKHGDQQATISCFDCHDLSIAHIDGEARTYKRTLAHTESPYTDTITGLTAGETYDIRMTYSDADGVNGTNPQIVTAISSAPQTLAGTATAVTVDPTSIAVSMPYTQDYNGDNTYTVEYKLSSSGTWLDWGTNPKAHIESPYTDTITGLTAGETYDVQLTYNDPDGVDGTNPQVVTVVMPDNKTTAGTATAIIANPTSIAVSMPYTDDDNGDNDYTVEYKLSSSATWLDWGTNPKTHTASPYTDTITGLTADETYDVQLTYNDADGVNGTNPQIVNGIVLINDTNATYAGTATVVVTSSTSFTIIMPYEMDVNGNNNYTILFKQHDASTWINWPGNPQPHSASPFTTDGWGVTPGESYDIQMTYNDPDGVYGINTQTVTIVMQENYTTAGTATAVMADPTSIAVSMPYTEDVNSDNTYTVEYKLSSSGTWLDWGTNPKTHTESPYTDTITGLTPGETYDVRMTYNDEDGVYDTNPQVVTGIVLTSDDNATLAGTATVVVTSETTFTITMPYEMDANANNNYTILFKQHDAGTWIDWPGNPQPHSASPFTTDGWGLTPGESYDIQMTYNDTDGVYGTSTQTVTVVMPGGNDKTTVGTATAEMTDPTSIAVSMPYTNDDNGNNNYTVEYKLSSSATWLAWKTNNYQAGYRLKSVDGQAPMDIPRTFGSMTVDDFALCFSCHPSTPFLTVDNTDTNFRSDVNNNCEPLDPASGMVNKHWYHLQPNGAFNRWDSDWDGNMDSIISCPACHNVHGPKLNAGASHVPAMIRTGELIGRPDALNHEYFENSCPDKTRLVSNETLDSTGGMMKFQGPGPGTVAKNGVCFMCHNESQPYWREATDVFSCENCHE